MRNRLMGILAMTTLACASDKAEPQEQPAEVLTYWQDVAPIYMENCVECHQEGGIAPFRLDRFEDAKTWATASKDAVAARTMPPWLVKSDDSCGKFSNARWLADESIQKITRWVDDGLHEGTVRTDLALPNKPTLVSAVSFLTPNFTPEIVGGTLAEFDEYRCFLVDPALTEDTFLTGYEVLPGNAALVHHVLAMTVDPAEQVGIGVTNADAMAQLDSASPNRDGWPCFGLAGDEVEVAGVPVTWAPGMGVVDYPAGTGVRVPAGTQLVLQVHYNLADGAVRGQSDQTQVRLRFESSVDREGFFVLPDGLLDTLFTGDPDVLEAGQSEVSYVWTEDFDDELNGLGLPYIDVYGVFPHMHERGKSFTMARMNGTEETCAAQVDRWDFGWQLFYFYDEPIRFMPGNELQVTCRFDTTGAPGPVLPGWGTQNEMCLAGLFLVVP